MNNIRKIITERLDNARNDYRKYPVLSTNDITLGNIQAYQDCLNLFPAPRTEQEILNDFEKLGYKVVNSYNHPFIEMSKYNEELNVYEYIEINKGEHNYEKFTQDGVAPFTMQEHKLLNELFEVWGWL